MKKFLLAGVAFAALTGSPSRPIFARPAYAPPPVYSWSGLYWGGNIATAGQAKDEVKCPGRHVLRIPEGRRRHRRLPVTTTVRPWVPASETEFRLVRRAVRRFTSRRFRSRL
jgi:hypothetical protein